MSSGILLVVFAALRALETTGAAPVWVRNWGDDLLCLPLVLTGVLALHRVAGRPDRWTLPARHGLAVVVLYTLLFEVVLPRLGRGTADPLDAVTYLVGWLVFQVFLNSPAGARTTSPHPAT